MSDKCVSVMRQLKSYAKATSDFPLILFPTERIELLSDDLLQELESQIISGPDASALLLKIVQLEITNKETKYLLDQAKIRSDLAQPKKREKGILYLSTGIFNGISITHIYFLSQSLTLSSSIPS